MGGDTERPAILGPLQTTPVTQLTAGKRRTGEKDGRSPRPSSPSEIKKRTERSLEESNQRLKSIEVIIRADQCNIITTYCRTICGSIDKRREI